ncbi:hypothetical protein DPMN_156218 [Dreissena polymorpha]|uniref:Uncharacterized protein n=1 Tax=Dreissena polymorpha TaxID=45954 RepID=A0A9D4FPE7_DREPO|nr:hypothetical protein DPMN_156218 [Dreissena polymorpha]
MPFCSQGILPGWVERRVAVLQSDDMACLCLERERGGGCRPAVRGYGLTGSTGEGFAVLQLGDMAWLGGDRGCRSEE